MLPRNIAQTGTNYIYTWNPDWQKFQYLALAEKIRCFSAFVLEAQADFTQRAGNDNHALCLIVAPDLIFSPAADVIAQKPYTQADYYCLEIKLFTLQTQLDHRVAVITGAISYLAADNTTYKISSHIVTKRDIHYYDKKHSAENKNWLNMSIPMQSGEHSGIFEFHGRSIGLEICQDHEAGTLKKDLHGKTVDIHVLIANGQNVRCDNIATDINQKGLFIVCELQPGKWVGNHKQHPETAVYSVINSFTDSPKRNSTDPLRLKWLRGSGSFDRSISTTLVKPKSQPVGREGRMVIYRARNENQDDLRQQIASQEPAAANEPQIPVKPIINNFFGK